MLCRMLWGNDFIIKVFEDNLNILFWFKFEKYSIKNLSLLIKIF